MTKKKALLVVSGAEMQVKVIEIAQELGYWVVNTDGNPDCPGAAVADEFYHVSTYDVVSHINLAEILAKTHDLRGVFTAGADVEHVVAMAAAAARCPGVDPRAAYATHHKPAFREVLDRAGLPNVAWAEVATYNQAIRAAARICYPLVIKNTDGCASRGTTLLRTKPALQVLIDAFDRAKAASKSGTALIEQMMTGEEQTVETLMEGRRMHPCFITDRFFLDKGIGRAIGYCVESGMRNPSMLDWQTKEYMFAYARQAATALGVDIGAFKCDMMLTPDGPMIIEATLRLSGGFDCTHLVPAATGKQVVKAALLQACGEGLHADLLKATKSRHAMAVNLFPEPGRIVSIKGVEEARSCFGVEHVFLRYGIGDIIPPYKDCAARPIWVMASGETATHAMSNAARAAASIEIKTEPIKCQEEITIGRERKE